MADNNISFDSSQIKEIHELEETTVIQDDSYFLISLEELTRKINLLTLIKAMSGDDVGENSEYKFYTTKYIQERLDEIKLLISDSESSLDEYSEKIEALKTRVDISLQKFAGAIDTLDPKFIELEEKIQEVLDEKYNELANKDVSLSLNIDNIYNELLESYNQLRSEFTYKFEQLSGVVDSSGNITDALYNSLKEQIDSLKESVNNHLSDLKSNDVNLKQMIDSLKDQNDSFNDLLNNSYYNKESIDEYIKDLYSRIKVQIISSSTIDGKKVDVDDFTDDGFYFFTSSADASNTPENNTNGLLQVINMGNGNTPVIKHIWHRYGTINKSDHMMYNRTRFNNGSWSDWVRYLTDRDIVYGTEVPSALENGQIYIQYFV